MEEKDKRDIAMCGGHECQEDQRTENHNVCQARPKELAVWYTQM